jgi:geranylgeranyl diphosphate synthase type II
MPHPASYFLLKRLDFESLRHKRFFRSAAAAEWPHSRPVNIGRYLKSRQKTVDRALDGYLPKANVKPATIHKAMRYSLFAGGKRLRPILCLAAAEACGGKIANALPFACAFECIHTYSLVHDDLPSMDNDDFRRGRPTCHKVFGEGIAVLAGDALLTIAFEIVSRAAPTKRYSMATFLRETAVAAGSQRLIAGQVADLEAEGKRVTRAELRYVHENKTAAILSTSVRLGAMSANATTRQLAALTRFGRALGLAFQVIDDILDVTQTSEKLGKSAGKDIAAKKATYPAIIGLEASRVEARRLTKQAHNALTLFGAEADALHALANYLLEREY